MTGMRRFLFPFWDAARRSPWATLGGIVTTALSLAGVTLPSLVGLPSWAVFVVMLAAVLLASIVVYHVASLAWVAQADNLTRLEEDLRALGKQEPRIELGEPQLQPDGVLRRTQLRGPIETMLGTSGPPSRIPFGQRRISNYRIPVTNHGAPAPEVLVKIVAISPGVEGVSEDVPLHIAHDDPPLEDYRFKSSFSLASGDRKLLDVVAIDKQKPNTWYLWNIHFEDAVQEVKLGGTRTFTIRAYAGDVYAEERYEVYGDSLEARLEMRGPLPPP